MRARAGLALLLAAPPVSVLAEGGAQALRAGRYDEAIQTLRLEAQAGPGDARAHRLLVRALSEVGRYEEAEQLARGFMAAAPASPELWLPLAETLLAQGKADEATAAYERAVKGRASDALLAEARLAELRLRRGAEAEARRTFERLISFYNQSQNLPASALLAVGIACRHLGKQSPQVFKDALKAFDEAIAADPESHEARLLAGELFLEKYNGPDARAAFKEVLDVNPQQPRALLGMARCLDFDDAPGALELVKRALEVNPRFADARAFLAETLLAFEDYPEAAKEAQSALSADRASLPALAVLAAARYLTGDGAGFEEARKQALALAPRDAGLYNALAEACVRNRFYRQAVDFARQAVALDASSWRGHGLLGLNLLRLGKIEEGRRALEASFAGDPYNVWIKNTLDLLDTFPQYRESRSARFRFFVHGKEQELLAPYLAELAEEAYETLAQRYGYRPETPIRVEVYPSHADFSVRTVGLAGLGALGVCFGPVLALDSPSAREPGSFNWGSTLWHELAHSVTLGLSEHRVPRWLTEGISVYEERRARPGWGDDVGIEFLLALKTGKLLPLRDLNNGFVRPTSPEQVAISYYQASLVVERIERERGLAALLGLLRGHRDGKTTAALFPDLIGTSPDAFDAALLAELKARWEKPLAALSLPPPPGARRPTRGDVEANARKSPDDFHAQLGMGHLLLKEKKPAEALPYLEQARALFPEYVGDGTPYWPLAQIRQERGELRAAAGELERLTALNESHYRARLELAEISEKLGDVKRAGEALAEAVYIYPLEASLHQKRAELATKADRRDEAVRARASVVALDPVDKPEALYQLALALEQAGDARAARREVLRALELAPRFQRAQELLLRLHRAAGGPS